MGNMYRRWKFHDGEGRKQPCTPLGSNEYKIVEAPLIVYICPANDSVVRSLIKIPKLSFGLV